MKCQVCRDHRTEVRETRRLVNVIYRKRSCLGCSNPFWTVETAIDAPPKSLHKMAKGFQVRRLFHPKGIAK